MRPTFLFLSLASACLPTKINCGVGTHLDGSTCVVDTAEGEGSSEGEGEGTEGEGAEGEGADSGGEGEGSADSGDSGGTTDYTVCDDGVAPFDNLQDAVDAAANGDVIQICAGTWDRVDIENTDVSLVGVDGAERTIIDGLSGTSVTVEDSSVAISGLTISGTPGADQAGILATNASVEITDTRFANLVGTGELGSTYHTGINANFSDLSLDGCVFEDNTLTAAIAATRTGSLTLRHTVFRDNSFGSAVLTGPDVEAEVSNNLFVSNTVGTMIILNEYEVRGWAYNNLIWGNTRSGGYHYLVYVTSPGGSFENNIVASNIGSGVEGERGVALYNDVWDNSGEDMSGPISATNLSADPRLIDPDGGDFTLDTGFSPCVDAGDPLSGYDDPDGSANDMGAFGGPYGDWVPWP